jgi:surface polysaccharide O-acyltransferase-like enzyme
MNPDDISKKAQKEKRQIKIKKSKSGKKPFNPLDWMDFAGTRKWMNRNLKLSNSFYGYLSFLLMIMVVLGWIWWDNWDESKWEYLSFLSVTSLFIISCICGFIWGYIKAHKTK